MNGNAINWNMNTVGKVILEGIAKIDLIYAKVAVPTRRSAGDGQERSS